MADMTVEQALRVLDAHLTYVSEDKDWQEAKDALATLRAELDGLREKSSRAYVAEQMRGLVPGSRSLAHQTYAGENHRAGHNACRATTLANIERWEQQP